MWIICTGEKNYYGYKKSDVATADGQKIYRGAALKTCQKRQKSDEDEKNMGVLNGVEGVQNGGRASRGAHRPNVEADILNGCPLSIRCLQLAGSITLMWA